MAQAPTGCCPTDVVPDAVTGGNAAGTFVQVPFEACSRGTFTAYITHGGAEKVEGASRRAVLLIPDIFGFHPYMLDVCDRYAKEAGAVVIMPDFFDGKPWRLEDLPPPEPAKLYEFLDARAFDTDLIQSRVHPALKFLKGQFATEVVVGSVGVCWGASISLNLNAQGVVSATAMPHPSKVDAATAQRAQSLCLLMPSRDDGPMEEVRAALEAAGKLAGYRHFDDVHHGWLGARAKHTTDELCAKRREEGIALIVDFLAAHLQPAPLL